MYVMKHGQKIAYACYTGDHYAECSEIKDCKCWCHGDQTFTDFDEIIQSGKKYEVIYADPPWSYQDKATSGNRGAGCHYDTMSIDALCSMPIREITSDDCILFCWGTWTHLQEIQKLIRAWGFTYKTCGFVWVKTHANGSKMMGMGRYTRANSEYCLIATCGSPPRRLSAGVRQIYETETIKTEIKAFSQKPDIFRSRITKLIGDKRTRIELFARTKIDGWDVFGNDEKLKNNPLEEYI